MSLESLPFYEKPKNCGLPLIWKLDPLRPCQMKSKDSQTDEELWRSGGWSTKHQKLQTSRWWTEFFFLSIKTKISYLRWQGSLFIQGQKSVINNFVLSSKHSMSKSSVNHFQSKCRGAKCQFSYMDHLDLNFHDNMHLITKNWTRYSNFLGSRWRGGRGKLNSSWRRENHNKVSTQTQYPISKPRPRLSQDSESRVRFKKSASPPFFLYQFVLIRQLPYQWHFATLSECGAELMSKEN